MADEIDDAIPRRPGESDAEYAARLKEIKRLKENLDALFEKHIEENEGQPEFASDIEDPAERAQWEKQQLAQWNERHAILKEVVGLDGLKREEIDISDTEVCEIEYRQRWLTEDGKAFLDKIIEGLKKREGLWDPNDPDTGVDWGPTTLEGDRQFRDFYYVSEIFENYYLDLRYIDLAKCELSQANLRGADLEGANLQGTSLKISNLQDARLFVANLQDADLSKANLQGADLEVANLQGAKLLYTDVQDANLEATNLEGAMLSVANLQGAYLHEANLRGVDLEEANLRGANLLEANLQNANLRWPTFRELFSEKLTFEVLI